MVRKYFLIVAGSLLSASSKFYTVEVSSSSQGLRDYNFIKDWAARHNYYWHIFDKECADFRLRIAQSFGMQVHEMHSMKLTARALVRYIKEHLSSPAISPDNREAIRLREILKPDAYFRKQISVLQRAEAYKRNKPKSKQKGNLVFLPSLKIQPVI